jgi:pyruvate dehydrogenase E1 component beta subunit
MLAPAAAADAPGLMVSALRVNEPVLVIDPKDPLMVQGEILDGRMAAIPFGDAHVVWLGDALTVVTWTAPRPKAIEAGGFGAEVVSSMIERLGPSGVQKVKRLGAPRVPLAFAPPLETHLRLTTGKIIAVARATVR